MAKRGITMVDTLVSSTGKFPIAYATEIAGHRSVPTMDDLYNIGEGMLSESGDNTNNDAIGQLWWVVSATLDDTEEWKGGFYQLINWDKRKEEEGWIPFNTGNGKEYQFEEQNEILILNEK